MDRVVRYAPPPPRALDGARALALAAEALLELEDAPTFTGPLDDEERLREALERVAERRGGEGEEAAALAQEALERLLGEGWIERLEDAGGVRFAASPALLTAATRRALARLFPRTPPRDPGRGQGPGVEGPHEPHGPARPWRWGEPLNLDAGATLKSWILRGGDLRSGDLHVREGEGGRRAAVVLLLDCSHSMVLYGADRFGPARRLALALEHWTRSRGDELAVICFHDRAELVPPRRLPFLQAQPSHTNTAAALARAHRWLRRRAAGDRLVLLVTDGRPTAIELADGALYKNAWGLDERIVRATLAQAARLRRLGARLEVYMLGDEPEMVAFVHELARVARGRAVATTPRALGRRVWSSLAAAG